jgi:hypothetical protein
MVHVNIFAIQGDTSVIDQKSEWRAWPNHATTTSKSIPILTDTAFVCLYCARSTRSVVVTGRVMLVWAVNDVATLVFLDGGINEWFYCLGADGI